MSTNFYKLIMNNKAVKKITRQAKYYKKLHVLFRVEFGRMSTFRTGLFKGFVHDIEVDLANSSQFIVATVYALWIWDGAAEFSILAGNPDLSDHFEGNLTEARFRSISGFCQMNASAIAVADHGSNCLRYVDRQFQLTETLAGGCRNTHVNQRFFEVSAIACGLSDSYIYFTTLRSNCISVFKGLDRPWWENEQIFCGKVFQPQAIIPSGNGGWIICNRYGIVKDNLSIGHQFFSGFKDGKFKRARFYHPTGLASLSDSITLVADDFRLRVINENEGLVSSYCPPTLPTNECEDRFFPRSLLRVEDTIYIGRVRGISIIKCK